jgi:hypothetical protein
MLTNYLRDKEQLYYATSTYQHRHHRSSNRNKSVIVLLKNTNSSLSFFLEKIVLRYVTLFRLVPVNCMNLLSLNLNEKLGNCVTDFNS